MKDDKKTLTPKLRFPEFKGEPWGLKRLEDFAPLQRGFDLPSTELQAGNIPVVYSNGIQSFHSTGMARGPGLVTGRSGTIGRLHFIEDGEYWPHNTSLWVTSFNGNDPKFVYYLYDSIGMGRFATGSGVPTLNRNDVHAFQASVPPSLAEQRKIAACLTSLDEWIVAEGRKLEGLRAHKKGLMQQLFPSEGQMRPRLRFPEFRDDERSRFKPVGEFAKVTTGDKDTQNKVDTGEYPFFVRSQNVERIDSFSHDGEAILTSGDGVGVGENYHYINGKFDFHQRVYCIYDFDNSISGRFFFHYFSTHFKKRVKQMSAKNSVDSIRMSMITEMPIWFPELAEQQRIAACLSSLDALIAAQSRKLDGLRAHKKGLMQQLFPSPEEV